MPDVTKKNQNTDFNWFVTHRAFTFARYEAQPVMHGVISTDAYAIPPQPNVHYLVSCHETNGSGRGHIQAERVYCSRLGSVTIL